MTHLSSSVLLRTALFLMAGTLSLGAQVVPVFSSNPFGDLYTELQPVETGTTLGSASTGQQWTYNNVRDGGVVGINGTHARSGNGSLYLATPHANAQASAEFLNNPWSPGTQNLTFGGTVGQFGQLSSLSYDWYRESASTSEEHPVLALQLTDGWSNFGYLVFEKVINQPSASLLPSDSWQTEDIFGSNYRMWATGSLLPNSLHSGDFQFMNARTLQEWMSLLPQFHVLSVAVGVGSLWRSGEPDSGAAFYGAVDNVTFGFAGTDTTFNFETMVQSAAVLPTAVPEPSTYGILGALLLMGMITARRLRHRHLR